MKQTRASALALLFGLTLVLGQAWSQSGCSGAVANAYPAGKYFRKFPDLVYEADPNIRVALIPFWQWLAQKSVEVVLTVQGQDFKAVPIAARLDRSAELILDFSYGNAVRSWQYADNVEAIYTPVAVVGLIGAGNGNTQAVSASPSVLKIGAKLPLQTVKGTWFDPAKITIGSEKSIPPDEASVIINQSGPTPFEVEVVFRTASQSVTELRFKSEGDRDALKQYLGSILDKYLSE